MDILSDSRLNEQFPDADRQSALPATDIEIVSEGHLIRIELYANARSNRRALLCCMLFLSITAISIAIIFALFGVWLILPFAGMEILLLAVGTHIACSHSDDADLLIISRNYVHLTQRRRTGCSVSSFIRPWMRFSLLPGTTGHEPIRLLIVDREEEFEFGEFLIESSKIRLFQQLTEQIRNRV